MKPTVFNRIFLNWFDSYAGQNIAQHLSTCVLGSTLFSTTEEDVDKEVESPSQPEEEFHYELIGTRKSTTHTEVPSYITEVIKARDRQQLFSAILKSHVIIYDITTCLSQVEEAQWVLERLEEVVMDLKEPKIFLLLSTVLTWVKTKRSQVEKTESEDVEVGSPLTEDEYTKRKPHPNYRKHILLEKEVVRIGRLKPKKLMTYILVSGIRYGKGEHVLKPYFWQAWINSPALPVLKNSTNIVPMIYIVDLALIIQNIIEKKPDSPKYILGVDGIPNSFDSIVKAISNEFTTGEIEVVDEDDDRLEEIKEHYDLISANIPMESNFLSSVLNFKFSLEGGFIPNIHILSEEYRDFYKLRPIRVMLHSPPGVLRMSLLTLISVFYRLEFVVLGELVETTIQQTEELSREFAEVPENATEEQQQKAELKKESIVRAQEFMSQIRESQELNDGKLDDSILIKIVQDHLLSKPCQNQGYVLEGFPKTIQQAKQLFAGTTEGEEGSQSDGTQELSRNEKIIPDLVINMSAPKEYLENRIMQLSQEYIEDIYGGEERVIQMLEEYFALDNLEDTVLNFFEDNKVPIMKFDVSKERLSLADQLNRICKLLGPPRQFGITAEEKAVLEEDKQIEKEEALLEEQKALKVEALAEVIRKNRMFNWERSLKAAESQEEHHMEMLSQVYLRRLMTNIYPILNKAMQETHPSTPVDTRHNLSCYLLKYSILQEPLICRKASLEEEAPKDAD